MYYFSVQNDALRSAMERFAAFFVCPLFDESCVERETMAVDSENTKNIQSDLWRQYQLLRGQAKQTHPMCQFSTGNVDTLRNGPVADGLNVRDVLLDFYHKYYSANAMKVVVYGKDKLDEMQGWVEDMFGRVENTDRDVLHVPTQPWGPSELSKMIIMKAVKDVKSLQITIPLAEQHSNYRSKPSTVLSHLIGHESAGSMLSALKDAGLANELGAHTSRQYRDFAVFQTDITLTAKGLANPDEVLECFWAYIGMLKAEGAHDWIAEEVQHIGALEFRFREKEDPAYYASSLANNMHIYDPKDIISGAEIISEVRHDLYTSVLDRMVVENSLIFLLNQSAAAESLGQTCQWYGTEYGAHGYTEDQVNRWRDAMAGKSKWSDKIKLPQPNPFVPSDFTLQPIHVSRRSLLDADGFARPVLLGRDRVGPCYKDELFSTAEEEAAEGLEMASLSTGEAETGEEEEKEEGEEEEDAEEQVHEKEADEEVEEEIPARESQAEGEGGDVVETEAERGGPSSDTTDSSCGRVGSTWYLQDAKWKVPRTNVTVQIQVWDAYSSPTCAVLTSLYVSVLQELVAEYSYYADCAGLYFRIYESFEGLELNVLGYSDKLNVLLEKLLDQMNGLKQANACPAETFLRLKEQLVRVYKNKRFVQPYQRCMLGMDDCMLAPRWNYEDRHAALVPITQTRFELFSRSLFDNASTRVIVAGNANPKVACEYSQSVRAKLGSAPLAFSHKPFRRSVRLEPRTQYVYRQYAVHNNPAELNSAVKNSYFISRTSGYMPSSMGAGPASPEVHVLRPGIIEEAKVKLLGLIISDAAFVPAARADGRASWGPSHARGSSRAGNPRPSGANFEDESSEEAPQEVGPSPPDGSPPRTGDGHTGRRAGRGGSISPILTGSRSPARRFPGPPRPLRSCQAASLAAPLRRRPPG
mgnify:CR=1 FL=1